MHGPSFRGAIAVKDASGNTLLTEPSAIVQRWAEHFEQVWNRTSIVNNAVFEEIQQPTLDELAAPIQLEEVKTAIKLLKNGKARGADGLAPEIFKYAGPDLVKCLYHLFETILTAEAVPQDFKDATITHLFKCKGDRVDCNNHGISLLSIAGKILARIINSRISILAESLQPESQCSYRTECGTVDMIFVILQLQEKCREQHQDLYLIFVDLTKAFDPVSCDSLWKILNRTGCPDKLVNILCSFQNRMQVCVIDGSQESAPFKVKNGVKQGCVFAPVLFGISIAAMIKDTFKNCNLGVRVGYWHNGWLFNPCRLKTCTKVRYALIRELLYADDCTLAFLKKMPSS